jgi:hypothetical protein
MVVRFTSSYVPYSILWLVTSHYNTKDQCSSVLMRNPYARYNSISCKLWMLRYKLGESPLGSNMTILTNFFNHWPPHSNSHSTSGHLFLWRQRNTYSQFEGQPNRGGHYCRMYKPDLIPFDSQVFNLLTEKFLFHLCLRKSTFFFFSSWIWWSLSFSWRNCAPQFWHLRIGLWCTSFECLMSWSCLSKNSWQISQRFFLRKSKKPISLH